MNQVGILVVTHQQDNKTKKKIASELTKAKVSSGEYNTVRSSLRQISYRMLSFHRQVLSGDLRTLAGRFSRRNVTHLLQKL
jgi:D-Tyr-tRNAtyr deacylase